jgi:hypothetical protein
MGVIRLRAKRSAPWLVAVLSVAGLSLAACGEAIPAWEPVPFDSGRVIKVLSVRQVNAAGGVPGVHLRYEAEAPFDDRSALQAEAAAVWNDFRPKVEALGASAAILDAVSPEAPGWDRSRQTLQFQVRRGESGDWQLVGALSAAREDGIGAADLNSQLTTRVEHP